MTEEGKLILEKLEEMRGDITEMRGDITEMRKDIADNKEAIMSLRTDVDAMRMDITEIRLTQENVLSKNIMRVAEGHLDLNRKLDEAMKAEWNKELVAIRVNILESDVRKLKQATGIMA